MRCYPLLATAQWNQTFSATVIKNGGNCHLCTKPNLVRRELWPVKEFSEELMYLSNRIINSELKKKKSCFCTLTVLLFHLELRFICNINTLNFRFWLLLLRYRGSWNTFLRIAFLSRGIATNWEILDFLNDLALEYLSLSPESLVALKLNSSKVL